MNYTQLRYKRDFDEKVKLPQKQVIEGSLVFNTKDYHPTDETRHKLAPIAIGTHEVVESDDTTCVIMRGDGITERINLDRVVLAPRWMHQR